MLIFEICLSLKELLVVTFGEIRVHTSRKYVVVQGMNLLKSSKKQITLVALVHLLTFEVFYL